MLSIQQNVDLTSYNTLHLTALSEYYCQLEQLEQLPALANLISEINNYFILGGGSNIILPPHYSGLIIHNRLRGISIKAHDDDHYLVSAAAGENWDKFVAYCTNHGAYGLENLSLIPGTVGAAPVQNIGAYGVEVKDFIDSVEVYDLISQQSLTLSNADCQFSYRHSYFKSMRHYLITKVSFKLPKQAGLNLNYADIKQQLSHLADPSPADLRQCIIQTRQAKLPDPARLANAGSFFHNPIIPHHQAQALKKVFPELPVYPLSDPELSKVSAGWLIDKLGLKGYRDGNLGVYAKQALVIVNYATATKEELINFAGKIQQQVAQHYNISLHIEPIIL